MPGTVYHYMIDGTVILGGAAELFPEGKEDGIVRGTVEGAVALCVIQMDVTALGIIRDDLLCARVGACVCGQWLFVLCGQPLALIDAFSIPSVCWSDHESFDWCFDGEPVGGCVAVSSVGTQKSPSARSLFMDGYNEMLRRLRPERIIFFGDVPFGCTGNIEQHAPYYQAVHARRRC